MFIQNGCFLFSHNRYLRKKNRATFNFIDNKENKKKKNTSLEDIGTLRPISEATRPALKLEEKEASFAELASDYALGSEKEFNGMIGPVELRVLDHYKLTGQYTLA